MRVHYLQHVPFEGPGSIESYLKDKGHQISSTHLYLNQPLPRISEIDWLIIMGGPMGIYDDDKYLWLAMEKAFIKKAIEANKIVLGVCLGAQMIANALGSTVYKNKFKEIGWFDVYRNPAADSTILTEVLPASLKVLHWHNDTFDLPAGADLLASSTVCKNQAFIYSDKVLALQFHLETTANSLKTLIANCQDDLDESSYVQTEKAMFAQQNFSANNRIMYKILDKLGQL